MYIYIYIYICIYIFGYRAFGPWGSRALGRAPPRNSLPSHSIHDEAVRRCSLAAQCFPWGSRGSPGCLWGVPEKSWGGRGISGGPHGGFKGGPRDPGPPQGCFCSRVYLGLFISRMTSKNVDNYNTSYKQTSNQFKTNMLGSKIMIVGSETEDPRVIPGGFPRDPGGTKRS